MVKPLGTGADKTVSLIQSKKTRKQYALLESKKGDAEAAARLRTEMELLVWKGKSQGIVKVVGYLNETPPCFVEEYCPFTLASYMKDLRKQNKRVSRFGALSLLKELCQVLVDLHADAVPIVHMDLKPANILLTSDLQLRLADLGAHVRIGGPERKLQCTPNYAAPEIVSRTKVFSLQLYRYVSPNQFCCFERRTTTLGLTFGVPV